MLKKEELEEGGIYMLKARNLVCGIYHDDRFYGLRSKFDDTFVSYEWCKSETKEDGTAEAVKQIGTADIPSSCYSNAYSDQMLRKVLDAVDDAASDLYGDEESLWYPMDRVRPFTLKEAHDAVQKIKLLCRAECVDAVEASQMLNYIAASLVSHGDKLITKEKGE